MRIFRNDAIKSNATLNTIVPTNNHLTALDGVRGLLALWVYLGHLANSVGFHNYVLAAHALAVDFFMILSGFLMVHTWKANVDNKQLSPNTTLQFYVARFFRIAPLYYFLLLVCYLLLPTLSFMHAAALKAVPPPWAVHLIGYGPSIDWSFDSFRWLSLHLSFAFGIVPDMVSSTPLPDWSLSLEMQFYLVFPLLLLLFARLPIILLAIGAAALAIASPLWFGHYLKPGSLAHFGQPSLLPYRLNAFVAGMLIAYFIKRLHQHHRQGLDQQLLYLIICMAVCIFPLSKPVILGFCCLTLLITWRIPIAATPLSAKWLRTLGDISYSVYLSHLLIVIPAIYWLVQQKHFMGLTTSSRFMVATLITAPVVLLVSYLLFNIIERPGIALGRRVIKNIQ
jgi:peptidoglycan/LPS O-acetylase OafA/YrhL